VAGFAAAINTLGRVHHARHSAAVTAARPRSRHPALEAPTEGGTALGRSALEITHAMLAAVREPRTRAGQAAPGDPHHARGSSRRRRAPGGRSATGSRAPCHHGHRALAAPRRPSGPRVHAPSLQLPQTREPTRRRTPRQALGRAPRRPGSCDGGALRLSSLIEKECCNCRLTYQPKSNVDEDEDCAKKLPEPGRVPRRLENRNSEVIPARLRAPQMPGATPDALQSSSL
jgi:hypothetical protein